MRTVFVLSIVLLAGIVVAQPEDSAWVSYYNGVDGWFSFQGPQRAMKLHPADFNLRYPFQVESLKTWWYWGMGSRQDTVFTFRIYEGDGISLLWESESLVAPSTNWTYYGLSTPVTIDSGDFWIATTHRLVNPFAHPYVNVDSGPTSHSYYGSPGAWILDNVGEFCFFAFVREIPMGIGMGNWVGRSPQAAGPTIVRGVLRVPRDMTETRDMTQTSDVWDRVPSQTRPVLLDASGRKAMPLVLGDNDISSLVPGVYFIRNRDKVHPVTLIE